MRATARVLLALAAGSLAACETIDSADVRTSGIHAAVEVTADGAGDTRVRAELRAGGGASNTFLELASGDRLSAFAESAERGMRERGDPFERVWYEADFPIDAAGTIFRVALARDEHEDADESVVRLPAPFTVTRPTARETFAFDEDTIPITWSEPAADEMQLRVAGDCVRTFERVLSADTGRYLLHPGTLTPREVWSGDRCELDITLTRLRAGAIDPGFAGGRVVARQERVVSVRVVR